MRDLTLKVNGKVHGYSQDMDEALEVMEELWNAGKGHVQVVDERGEIVAELEV